MIAVAAPAIFSGVANRGPDSSQGSRLASKAFAHLTSFNRLKASKHSLPTASTSSQCEVGEQEGQSESVGWPWFPRPWPPGRAATAWLALVSSQVVSFAKKTWSSWNFMNVCCMCCDGTGLAVVVPVKILTRWNLSGFFAFCDRWRQ